MGTPYCFYVLWGSRIGEIEDSGLSWSDNVSLAECFPTFRISVLTSSSRVKFTMKILLAKRGSNSASDHHIPMSRNLTGRNATVLHVRSTKLTGIIQLVMAFRPRAFVVSIKEWLNLLIWLAGIQASSLMLFSRQYVYLISAQSVDNTLLFT